MRVSWEIKKLGSVCENLDSQRKPITQRNRILGEIPYYGATGIVDYVKDYLFDEKLVLLGEDGAKWSSGDECAFMIEGKTWVNNHAHVLRPNRKLILDEWLIYNLNFQDLSPYITGMTVPKLNQGKMNEIRIPIPPLPEQKRIVAILDEAFAAIDKAKANILKNLQNAKELFESYLQDIFTRKFGGLEQKKLGELCERVSVGHVGPTSEFYCDSSVGIPFLRSQNVRSGNLDWKGVQYITKAFHKKLKKSQLKTGDLLFVRVGANRGDCCVIKENVGELNCANIVFARLKEGNVDFIDRYCQSKIGREQLLGMTVGAAQGVINTKSVAELVIPYPNLSEQLAFVKDLDCFSIEINKSVTIYQQKLDALEELKKSILQKAFNGELTAEVV